MKKNDTAVVRIEDIGINGEGIGKADGYTLFIKDTVMGDLVEVKVMKAKKNYGYAKLLRVIEPSKNRVEAKCPVAKQCGGCQIQEMDYQEQLQFKQKKVIGNLERIGGFAPEVLEKIRFITGIKHSSRLGRTRTARQSPDSMREGHIRSSRIQIVRWGFLRISRF